jgi:hypothetical protein
MSALVVQSIIKALTNGEEIKMELICNGLTTKEKRHVKLVLANQLCEEVWSKYMGEFERTLDRAFTSIIRDT